jgi:hypothetical protein
VIGHNPSTSLTINRDKSALTSCNAKSSTPRQQESPVVAQFCPVQIAKENPCKQNDTTSQIRDKDSAGLGNDLRKLGADLPGWMLDKITTSYTGMTPMERFLAETGQGLHESLDVQIDTAVSDCGAVGSMSEGVGFSETAGEFEPANAETR